MQVAAGQFENLQEAPMANPTTASANAAKAIIDEAVRITADSSRRTADTAQAAFAASRQYVDVANQINRDFLSLMTSATETSLQTTFEVQNAVLARSQAVLETSANLSKDALDRWFEVIRQAQATTLKSYESSAKLLGSLIVIKE
jgi:hypothetical protein